MIKQILLMVLLLMSLPTKTVEKIVTKDVVVEVKLEKINYSIVPFYDQEIYDVVRRFGYSHKMALMIVAQSRHESGTYKSKLFREATNAFGMLKHRKDTLALTKTFSAEGRGGYAGYDNLRHSTLAALALLTRLGCKFNYKNEVEYSTWLKDVNYYMGYPEYTREENIKIYANSLRAHVKRLNIQDTTFIEQWTQAKTLRFQ